MWDFNFEVATFVNRIVFYLAFKASSTAQTSPFIDIKFLQTMKNILMGII